MSLSIKGLAAHVGMVVLGLAIYSKFLKGKWGLT